MGEILFLNKEKIIDLFIMQSIFWLILAIILDNINNLINIMINECHIFYC